MEPEFQLIDSGWGKIVRDSLKVDRTELQIVCPFIKLEAVKRLLTSKPPGLIRVITRFNLAEMCDGVSDTKALRLLLEYHAKIRGVQNLHAKLYLFGDKRAIITSANLTKAALTRNHEFGFASGERAFVECCREYFEGLWKQAGDDLDLPRLESWEKQIERVGVADSRPSSASGLSDEGTKIVLVMSPAISLSGFEQNVKVFHDSADRPAAVQFRAWCEKHPRGYYLNATSSDSFMVHKSGCPHVGVLAHGNSPTSNRKICSSSDEDLVKWASDQGSMVLKCRTCMDSGR
jgi:hypothetical protein